MTSLVLGATGFVGRALIPSLVAAGERVRAASRRSVHDSLAGVEAGVEWVTCDVRAPDTLGRALSGVDCLYYLVHSMGDRRADFREVERRSAADVARVATERGVGRIVYLGGVEPVGAPSEHLASRLEVGAELRAGTVPTLELRSAMVIGNGSASWQILRDLALRLPFMLLPRWLESRSCPIALPDAVTAMRVPLLSPRLSAGWLKLVSGAEYDVARELVLGLKTDLLPRDARYWELTGHPPRRLFRAAAEEALRTAPRRAGVRASLAREEERVVRALFRTPAR